MERRYEAKVKQAPDQTKVPAEISERSPISPEEFVAPYAIALNQPEQRRHAVEYMTGLLSKLEHKTGEAIAYLHDQERQGIQKFIGHVPWDHQPLLMTLARQVGQESGETDAVIAFATSSFPKKGVKSVGVTRQWGGRDGKSENCQIGVYMAYITSTESTLVDIRLHLPKEWANDRARRAEAGIPKSVRFQTQQELALAMLKEQGPLLPHAWVTTEEALGYPETLRESLRKMGQRYLLPLAPTTSLRDLAEPSLKLEDDRDHVSSFVRVDRWCPSLPNDVWMEVEVHKTGENGSRINRIEAMSRPVQLRISRREAGPQELLFATRTRSADGTFNYAYYLSNADPGTSLQELARVAGAAHRGQSCIEFARREAGLADYQVRNWIAWHHHQTLSLLAARFLTLTTPPMESQGGTTEDAAPTVDYCENRGGHSCQPIFETQSSSQGTA